MPKKMTLLDRFTNAGQEEPVDPDICGVTITKDKARALSALFAQEGYAVYEEIMRNVQAKCVAVTLGSFAVEKHDRVYQRNKGRWGLAREFLGMPRMIEEIMAAFVRQEGGNSGRSEKNA